MVLSSCKDDENVLKPFDDSVKNSANYYLLNKYINDGHPGIIVSVYSPERGYFNSKIGVANFGTKESINNTDEIRIGGVSKTFVACIIHKLVGEERLSLDDNIGLFFPDVVNAENISVRDLLRMRSGIPSYLDSTFMADFMANPRFDYGFEDLAFEVNQRKGLAIKQDSITVLSNFNYVLLSKIIEKIEGKDIDEVVSKDILMPYNLNDTRYPVSHELNSIVKGYAMADSVITDYTNISPSYLGAGGSMVSTVSDLFKFSKAFYEGKMFANYLQVDRKEMYPIDQGPRFLLYGEGIMNYGNLWGYSGSIVGFSTDMWYLPEEDAHIVISVNRSDEFVPNPSFDLLKGIMPILFPEYNIY